MAFVTMLVRQGPTRLARIPAEPCRASRPGGISALYPAARRWASRHTGKNPDSRGKRSSNGTIGSNPSPPRRIAGQKKLPTRPSGQDKGIFAQTARTGTDSAQVPQATPPTANQGLMPRLQSMTRMLWSKVAPKELPSQLAETQAATGKRSAKLPAHWDSSSPSDPPARLHKVFHPAYRFLFHTFVRMERARFTMRQAFWLSIWISFVGYFWGTLRGQQIGIHNVALEYNLDPSGEKGALPSPMPISDQITSASSVGNQLHS